MDVKKELGRVSPHRVSDEDMALIHQLSKAKLLPEQVYTFAVRLCDNDVDRDWERFDENALEALSRLFVGKSGVFDHNWSAKDQTARLYKTEVCREDGATCAGGPRMFLKGYAYMLRSEKNRALIEEIEAGIKKEVSIGCSVAGKRCSICGEEHCSHTGGETYDGKLCFFTLTGPVDAYEWSFVAVPAQRKAGVMKRFDYEGERDLKKMLSGHPACLKQLELLEKEARLGRAYLDGLRKELVRLAGMTDEALDLKIFSSAAAKLEEQELLELTKAYRRRMDGLYPPSPQLAARNEVCRDEEDRAFLI